MTVERQVLFIHGAGGGGWEWDRWVTVFRSRGWTVMAPDLVPAPTGLAATRFEDYLEQVIRLLPDDPRPVLVAASMGGPLALKVAERAPVSAVVLVNSIPPAGTPGWPVRDTTFPPVIPWSTSSLENTRASLSDADEDTIRWAHARWRDESGAVMRALYEGIPASCPTVPILAIVGKDDDDAPADVGLALGNRLAADTMVFSEVSHVGALLGRRAGLIARLACGWLEGVL